MPTNFARCRNFGIVGVAAGNALLMDDATLRLGRRGLDRLFGEVEFRLGLERRRQPLFNELAEFGAIGHVHLLLYR
jgi:hypothetical protein